LLTGPIAYTAYLKRANYIGRGV